MPFAKFDYVVSARYTELVWPVTVLVSAVPSPPCKVRNPQGLDSTSFNNFP
jgi:hypothetical protein